MTNKVDFQTYLYLNHNQFIIYVVEILTNEKIYSEKLAIEETDKYLEIFKNNPYIFNLGHGILPETNPDIIKKIVDKVNLIKR